MCFFLEKSPSPPRSTYSSIMTPRVTSKMSKYTISLLKYHKTNLWQERHFHSQILQDLFRLKALDEIDNLCLFDDLNLLEHILFYRDFGNWASTQLQPLHAGLFGACGVDMVGPKSVIEIRDSMSFLDLSVRQIEYFNRICDINGTRQGWAHLGHRSVPDSTFSLQVSKFTKHSIVASVLLTFLYAGSSRTIAYPRYCDCNMNLEAEDSWLLIAHTTSSSLPFPGWLVCQ